MIRRGPSTEELHSRVRAVRWLTVININQKLWSEINHNWSAQEKLYHRNALMPSADETDEKEHFKQLLNLLSRPALSCILLLLIQISYKFVSVSHCVSFNSRSNYQWGMSVSAIYTNIHN